VLGEELHAEGDVQGVSGGGVAEVDPAAGDEQHLAGSQDHGADLVVDLVQLLRGETDGGPAVSVQRVDDERRVEAPDLGSLALKTLKATPRNAAGWRPARRVTTAPVGDRGQLISGRHQTRAGRQPR
jgi:hypothetical protein